MGRRVLFTHESLSSGQHAIPSPDLEGFCVVGAPGDTRRGVEKQAPDVLIAPQERDGTIPRVSPALEREGA